MNTELIIVIINYKGLKQSHFKTSLYSLMSQIGYADFTINIYFEQMRSIPLFNNIKVIEIPQKYHGKAYKVKEFIINNTKTKYIAFWDADDVYTIDRIYHQINLIKEKDLDLCFADFSFFNESMIISKSFFKLIGINKRKIDILHENYIGLGIITAKTDFLKSLLPFPEVNTLDWWIAIKSYSRRANIGCVNKILGFYRVYDKSLGARLIHITIEDFIKERQNKIQLYKTLGANYLYLVDYYEKLNIKEKFDDLLQKYRNKQYKNIWGGLIDYEKD